MAVGIVVTDIESLAGLFVLRVSVCYRYVIPNGIAFTVGIHVTDVLSLTGFLNLGVVCYRYLIPSGIVLARIGAASFAVMQ
jgi:hypothetical protein